MAYDTLVTAQATEINDWNLLHYRRAENGGHEDKDAPVQFYEAK